MPDEVFESLLHVQNVKPSKILLWKKHDLLHPNMVIWVVNLVLLQLGNLHAKARVLINHLLLLKQDKLFLTPNSRKRKEKFVSELAGFFSQVLSRLVPQMIHIIWQYLRELQIMSEFCASLNT